MSWRLRHVGLVAGKELRETLRDRRTLIVMVLLPLVVYPLLALLSTQVSTNRQKRLEASLVRVGLGPADNTPELAVLHADVRRLAESEPARFAVIENARAQDVQTERIDVFVRRGADQNPAGAESAGAPSAAAAAGMDAPAAAIRVELVHDSARERSREGAARLAAMLAEVLSPGCSPRYVAHVEDVASEDDRGGYLLSRILPVVVVLMLMLGAFYPAIDTTAGERERGTLETTLVAPIARNALLLGKVLAVSCVALFTGLANLVAMALTSVQVIAIAVPEVSLPIPWPRVALAALGMLPSAFLFAALLVAAACTARNFKEAQNLVTPIYTLFLIPSVMAGVGDFELTPVVALIPGVNLTVFLRELILGRAGVGMAGLVVAATLVHALLALVVAVHLFDPERLLSVRDKRPRSTSSAGRLVPVPSSKPGVEISDALLMFALAFVGFFTLMPAQVRWPTAGLLVAQWLGMAGLAVVFVRVRGLDPRQAFGARTMSGTTFVGATALGLGAWLCVALLTEWILPPPPEVTESLKHALFAHGERPLWLTVFLVALTPAVCEELLFRGPILRGLLRGLPPRVALPLAALMFSLFHLNVYRLLPTFLLGLLLCWLAWRSGSVLPGMVTHFLNNGIVVVLHALGVVGVDEEFEVVHHLQLALGGAMLVALGLALVVRAHPLAGADKRAIEPGN